MTAAPNAHHVQPLYIVHTEASCGWGGQEIRILTEAAALTTRGHRVEVLCPQEAPLFTAALDRQLPVCALPIGRKNLVGLKAVYRWLKSHRVDVINTHSSTDSWLTALACRMLRNAPPIVRTRHISAAVSNNWPTRWLYQKAVSHIVTTGEQLRRQLIDVNHYLPTHVTSVPTGIDPLYYTPGDRVQARRRLGLDQDLTIIGIVATLRSWKGHEYLINAFSRITGRNCQLAIVGDGPRREAIMALVKSLNIEDRVIMPGNQRDVLPWLQAMDIFVLPSYANEGVPQSIVQAMSCELPVITTPVGGIPEAIEPGRTGLIVEPRSIDALCGALQEVISNIALRQRLGIAARKQAQKNFTLTGMAEKMEQIFLNTRHSHEQ